MSVNIILHNPTRIGDLQSYVGLTSTLQCPGREINPYTIQGRTFTAHPLLLRAFALTGLFLDLYFVLRNISKEIVYAV